MKRLLALCLALCMTLALVACGDKGPDVSGKYTCVGMRFEGIEELSEPTGDSWLELKQNGKGTSCDFGVELNMTWELDGENFTYTTKFLGMKNTLSGTLKDNVIEIDNGYYTSVYLKEGAKMPESDGSTAVESVTEAPVEQPTEEPGEVLGEAEFTGGTVRLIGAEAFKDSDEKDAIRVYYEFTNTSEESLTAYFNVDILVMQDGYEQVDAYPAWNAYPEEYQNATLYLRPGATVRCVDEYSFKPDGGTITVTLTDYRNDDISISAELDPQNLPGAPKSEFIAEPITAPTWTEQWPEEGVYKTDYYMAIGEAEVVPSYEGEDLIRIYFEFTNNSEEATSFWLQSTLVVYQDGIQLLNGIPKEQVDSDGNYSVDIDPGATVTVSCCFELRSDSPVEVELEDFYTGEYIACYYTIG